MACGNKAIPLVESGTGVETWIQREESNAAASAARSCPRRQHAQQRTFGRRPGKYLLLQRLPNLGTEGRMLRYTLRRGLEKLRECMDQSMGQA